MAKNQFTQLQMSLETIIASAGLRLGQKVQKDLAAEGVEAMLAADSTKLDTTKRGTVDLRASVLGDQDTITRSKMAVTKVMKGLGTWIAREK